MKLSKIANKMIRVVVICSLLITAMGAVLTALKISKFVPIVLGVILGSTVSILRVVMIDRTVKKLTSMETENPSGYVSLQHILRFVVSGVIMTIAAVVPFINTYSAAAGVLSFQAATMSVRNVASFE